MAAHGTGAFENDNAADLILDIHGAKSWTPAIEAVRTNLVQDEDLRDCMNAEFAVASIALALAKSKKFEFEKFAEQCWQIGVVGDDPIDFLDDLPAPPPEILSGAISVLETILSADHALSFSWSETEHFESWQSEIKYIKELISE